MTQAASTTTTPTDNGKKRFFENLFKKKEPKVYDSFLLPDGTIINGPLADHFRNMTGIGRGLDSQNFDKRFNEMFDVKAEPAATVKEGKELSPEEKEAVVNTIRKTEPEPTDAKPVAEAIVEGLSAAVAESAQSPTTDQGSEPDPKTKKGGQK